MAKFRDEEIVNHNRLTFFGIEIGRDENIERKKAKEVLDNCDSWLEFGPLESSFGCEEVLDNISVGNLVQLSVTGSSYNKCLYSVYDVCDYMKEEPPNVVENNIILFLKSHSSRAHNARIKIVNSRYTIRNGEKRYIIEEPYFCTRIFTTGLDIEKYHQRFTNEWDNGNYIGLDDETETRFYSARVPSDSSVSALFDINEKEMVPYLL